MISQSRDFLVVREEHLEHISYLEGKDKTK